MTNEITVNFNEIISIIEKARAKIYKAVNNGLIDMYWEVGEYISRKVAGNGWGEGTIQEFSRYLLLHYPDIKGFSPQNIWRMKQFYETYRDKPKLSPLVREITWSNNLLILAGAKTDEAREFYILEFGKDFSLVGEEYRLQVGNQDFYIDLLFYNRELSCLVAIELKVEKFSPAHLGQLNFYLEALDRDVRKPHENLSVGLILCTSKDDTVVEYALSHSLTPALISEYTLKLPDKKLLQEKLAEITDFSNLSDE